MISTMRAGEDKAYCAYFRLACQAYLSHTRRRIAGVRRFASINDQGARLFGFGLAYMFACRRKKSNKGYVTCAIRSSNFCWPAGPLKGNALQSFLVGSRMTGGRAPFSFQETFAPKGVYLFQSAGGVAPVSLNGRFTVRHDSFCIVIRGSRGHDGCFELKVFPEGIVQRRDVTTGRIQIFNYARIKFSEL